MGTTRTTNPLRCDHGLRRRAIVQALLKEVFQAHLRPGQRLVTQELAERFGVSHTPIREALIELGGMGIVDLLPNRGAVVRRVTAREVREICLVRRALECAAVRSACGRIEVAELHDLAAGLRRLQAEAGAGVAERVQQARALDSRLHDLVASSSGNAFLAQELSRLKILFRAFRDLAYAQHQAHNDYRRLAAEAGEHLAVVEGLLAGDRRAAVRAMSRHILGGAKVWSQALPDASWGHAVPAGQGTVLR